MSPGTFYSRSNAFLIETSFFSENGALPIIILRGSWKINDACIL